MQRKDTPFIDINECDHNYLLCRTGCYHMILLQGPECEDSACQHE